MPSPSLPDGWKPLAAGPFMASIGPLLRGRDDTGKTIYGLQTGESHCNPVGTVHGGVIASVIDHALAVDAWNAAKRQTTVTIQLDTRFIGAARAGDFLQASVSLRHATRSLLFLDADLHTDGRPLATANAIMKIVSDKGP